MKSKLTLTIDEELIPVAKRFARSKGVSLSHLIESALREMSVEGPSFSQRWRGRFVAVEDKDERFRLLAEKYL